MTPAPPPPVGAPENVLGWYNLVAQKWEREMIAKNMLDTLAPDVDPQTKKYLESEYAFAQNELNNAHQLYVDALEDAGYPIDTRKTA